jgi:hypothetical protein
MAVAIIQLNLPEVIQNLIHSYVFFSKKESLQRNHKRKLIHHLQQCERWCFTDDIFTTFYYRKMVSHVAFPYLNHLYYVCEYTIMHAGFCNDCHNYLYANNFIPIVIECNCVPQFIPEVD